MAWHAQLDLDYSRQAARSVALFRHDGPLRVLKSLYPEAPQVCHNVLVHPPGGLVGGDVLDVRVRVGPGAHGLVTTPGATRFYRSEGELAAQRVQLDVAAEGRLEWLPLEALYYSGCRAENRLSMQLAPGAELMGWDIAALGLPLANQPFVQGRVLQHLELAGSWLERGEIAAEDERLLHSPLGLAGHRCLASLFFATGTPLTRVRRDAALEAAREALAGHVLQASAGPTSPNDRVVVVRVLGPVVEPVLDALMRVRGAWRGLLWELPNTAPRIWAM